MSHDVFGNQTLKQPETAQGAAGLKHEVADVSCESDPFSASAPLMQSASELTDCIRQSKKTLLFQAQRIEELESVLTCIVALSGKLRQLEAEANESL